MPNTEIVDFESSNQFNKLILDYAKGASHLNPFYDLPPTIQSYSTSIKYKQFNQDQRNLLVNELKQQYKNGGISLKSSDLTFKQIELLNQPNCYTITTGHQLCIFTGPLYFIHKIISAIQWCEELNRTDTQNKFVPIFWMASEDHDFEEVNHFNTNNKQYKWQTNSHNNPVGKLTLNELTAEFENWAELSQNQFTQEHLLNIMNCYKSSDNLATATRKLVHLLFKDYGLVILDGDSKAFKTSFKSFIKKDILHQDSTAKVSQTSINLKKLGYKTQVNARDINFFYINESGRNLIKPAKNGYHIAGTSLKFSAAEMANEIEQHPEKFSPNVILRPLYQEVILPNLSYIGGPGEIAYWLQLKDMFNHYQVQFPMLTLRNFVTIMHQRDYKKLGKCKVDVNDLFQPENHIRKKIIHTSVKTNLQQSIETIDLEMQQLIDVSDTVDNKMSAQIIKQKKLIKKDLKLVTKQLYSLLSNKNKKEIELTKSIKNCYFRKNTPQERYLNLMEFCRHQPLDAFIKTLYTTTKPNQQGVQVIIIPF